MNLRIIGLLFLASLLSNQIKAQELWIYVGAGDAFELQENSGTTFFESDGGLFFPVIAVGYIKRFTPKIALEVAPTFNIYKNPLYSSTDVWKNVNLEIPIVFQYSVASVKGIGLQGGLFAGFNLKSTLETPTGDIDIVSRTPYFGLAVGPNYAFGKFGLSVRVRYQFSDAAPKEFPDGNTSLQNYYISETKRVDFTVLLGYRIK